MVAIASAIRPPPPRPWIARKPISSSMLCDQPDSNEPTMNVMIASWNSGLRP